MFSISYCVASLFPVRCAVYCVFCPVYCAVQCIFVRYISLCQAFSYGIWCCSVPFCPISCVVYTVFVQYIVLSTVSLTVGGVPPTLPTVVFAFGALWPLPTSTKRVSLAKSITTNIRANSMARRQEGSMLEGMWEGKPIDGSSFRCLSITHCFEKYSIV